MDSAGAVEIVEAAVGFGWTWGAGDIGRFAGRVGWTAPEPVGTMRDGAVFSRTKLRVWGDSAMFWGSRRGLGYVRITVSDCPPRGGFGSADLLADALARVRAAFAGKWGEPENGAGPEEGPGWVFPNLVAGLAFGDGTVDLMLVNPVEQRYWMDRRHDAARRRTALGGWGRFAEDLAEYLDRLPADARLVVTAPGGRFVQVSLDGAELRGELSRSEFIDPTWRYDAEIEETLLASGWTAAEQSNWWRTMARGAGSEAISRFAACLVDALRTLNVRAGTDLVADAWVEGGEDLDIAPLGIAPHPTSRSQRAEFLRANAPYGFDSGPLRIEVPAAIEIARTAMKFDWTWSRADLSRFIEQVGWQPEGEAGRADKVVWLKTEVRVDGPRARFCYDGERLEAICLTISDSIDSYLFDEGVPAEIHEQLTAAYTRAVEGFRAEFGMPVHGTLWHAQGPVWTFGALALGLVIGVDTVELYLVDPAERARRLVLEQQRTARRAVDREWRQFFDDLAAAAAELTEGQELVVDAGHRGAAHIVREAEVLRVELDSEAGLGLTPRVTVLMLGKGWLRPGVERAVWRHRTRTPTLLRDFRRYVEFALWPLSTRMGPETLLRVRVNGVQRVVRTPSTGAVS